MCPYRSLLVSIQAFNGGLSRSILPIRTHSDIWFFQSTFKAASISGQLPFSSIRGGICSAQVQAQEGLSMNSLKRHKHAVLLVALIWVALVKSFSHWEVLGPVLYDLTIAIVMLVIFLFVFNRRVIRMFAF